MKKNLFKLFCLLAVISITTISCDKDDDNDDDANQFDPTDFKGELDSGVLTLDASQIYNLTGLFYVNDGAELAIPAGTRIEATGGTSAAIIVNQGGKITIDGTADEPVVMTSGLDNKKAGDWGGLVICGQAICNSGGGMSEVGDSPYGGDIDDDDSGSIRYLRIEYSGAAFNSEKEYNGFSLFGVGSGTTIEYVQIYMGADDGVEFYGGSVKANYIISTHNEDDQFDWTQGWTGGGENWYGMLDSGYGNRGIEADNWSNDHEAEPYASPVISNLTLIGAGDQGNEPQGMELRRGTKGIFDNVVIKNWKHGIRVTDDKTVEWMGNGLELTNVKFIDCITDVYARDSEENEVEIPDGFISIDEDATGAGAGTDLPEWAKGWTIGLE
ncbi:MAG: hypothetical protein ACOCWC_01120 [Bacteroidota bacterium]